MSAVLDRYELVTPASLADVLADLAAHPGEIGEGVALRRHSGQSSHTASQ